jgi:hypothetical protein
LHPFFFYISQFYQLFYLVFLHTTNQGRLWPMARSGDGLGPRPEGGSMPPTLYSAQPTFYVRLNKNSLHEFILRLLLWTTLHPSAAGTYGSWSSGARVLSVHLDPKLNVIK